MKKVLITGGCGFIGANLCRVLLSKYEVLVFDDLSRGFKGYLPDDVKFIAGDICNTSQLNSALQGVDIVVHLAAYGSVVESVDSPMENYRINVAGTISVLEAVRASGIAKMVFASTGGAIMGNTSPPVSESSLPKPISPYGAGKLCGEAYCHAYASAYSLDIVSLRFANVYGPYSAHKKGIITQYIKNLFNGDPLVVFGDGRSTRDYIHVADLCNGIKLAIESSNTAGEVFHLATGVETSAVEISKNLMRISNKSDHSVVFEPSRKGEVENNCADFDKAKLILGFSPIISLSDGLETTYEWFFLNKEKVLSTAASDS